jgi:predicted phosphodiesterase
VPLEVSSVADDAVVAFDGTLRRTWPDLNPDSVVDLDGIEVRTLPRPGELLCRVATVNDVHFGEVECGVIEGTDIGPRFSVAPGAEPYPEFMNRGAVTEMAAIEPAAVVVKGDLTGSGTQEEYQRFLACYQPTFGARLHHVRGNHDAYHGESFADVSTQEVVLEGVTLAIVDTARPVQVNGSLSVDQLDWLDDLAQRADRPVLVFGHHNIWNPDVDPRTDSYFGLQPDDSLALLTTFERRPSLRGYFAGHTHRNQRQMIGGIPFVEVACVKDYPGTWAEYRVFDGGILQIHHRIATPEALVWSEQTRHMYEGGYADYAHGALADRCFLIHTTP